MCNDLGLGRPCSCDLGLLLRSLKPAMCSPPNAAREEHANAPLGIRWCRASWKNETAEGKEAKRGKTRGAGRRSEKREAEEVGGKQ